MENKVRCLFDIDDFSIEEINELISTAEDIISQPQKYQNACAGKRLATLFFEPSTRTRLSFEAAMIDLGGSVIGFSEASSSSTQKGESVTDTIRVVGSFADIIAMRHPKEGAPVAAARKTIIPIINGGDGGHNHPTQTLGDLLTIKKETGRLENLTVGFCGDLTFGRTIHSLVNALGRYKGMNFVFISPAELKIPDYIKEGVLQNYNIPYMETNRIESVITNLDILYMTRVQKERFFNEADYMRLRDYYILDLEKLQFAKKDLIIMHPLPRVNEIAVEVDDDPRAKYFIQVDYGKYMRMALILKLLNIEV
ncbi:MAG: aspartate carbamoyltransferase [Clostridiaceae bacterium]|nr:aspartate carbamoyltransferase [Clostridiaceae bacterium]